MRVIVVGATGHIGSFLVPRLVAEGHEVIAISRGERKPYVDDPAGNRSSVYRPTGKPRTRRGFSGSGWLPPARTP